MKYGHDASDIYSLRACKFRNYVFCFDIDLVTMFGKPSYVPFYVNGDPHADETCIMLDPMKAM